MAGTPVWYELMTTDPAKVAPFYREVLGWSVATGGDHLPNGARYGMIGRADGGQAGGVLTMSGDMCEQGARPAWLIYFDVDDTDEACAKAQELGAAVQMPPVTMDNVGRMAMLADPQGTSFYVITPTPPEGSEPDGESSVFSPEVTGYCAWNELNTQNADKQEAFYSQLFDWEVTGEMPMPDGHTYKFVNNGELPLGAVCSMKPESVPSQWLPYFRVTDIDAAKDAVQANGGKVEMGPHEVPGGDYIIVGFDPDGAALGLVGRQAQ